MASPLLRATVSFAEMEVQLDQLANPSCFLRGHHGGGDWRLGRPSLPVCASASLGVLWPAEDSDLGLETLSHRTYLCLNRREGPGLLAPGKDKPGALPETSEPLLGSAAQFLP